jgi:hypothetical protein
MNVIPFAKEDSIHLNYRNRHPKINGDKTLLEKSPKKVFIRGTFSLQE